MMQKRKTKGLDSRLGMTYFKVYFSDATEHFIRLERKDKEQKEKM